MPFSDKGLLCPEKSRHSKASVLNLKKPLIIIANRTLNQLKPTCLIKRIIIYIYLCNLKNFGRNTRAKNPNKKREIRIRGQVLKNPHEIKSPTYRALCAVSRTMIHLNQNLLWLNKHALDTAHKARYLETWYISFNNNKLFSNFVTSQ